MASKTEARHIQLAHRACELIDEHPDSLTLTDLSEFLDVSESHLSRIFKQTIGITPRQYLEARRLNRLKKGLRTRETVLAALIEAGYGSTSRVYEKADAQLGMTPDTYRQWGNGMRIYYALADCSLGRLLLGATHKGISAIYFGEEDDSLIESLHQEYPKATIEPDAEQLQTWLKILLLHLKGEQPHLELPLDVQATAFQWRVWQELMKIPYGSTTTYGELAQILGEPGASRAVGRACATNPVSIVIPCHRVLRRDGQLGGYRWGLKRKQTLLDREKEGSTL